MLARHDGRLVAYVVAATGTRCEIGDLGSHLAGRLPDYLRPSAYVLVPRLPVNAKSLWPVNRVDRSRTGKRVRTRISSATRAKEPSCDSTTEKRRSWNS